MTPNERASYVTAARLTLSLVSPLSRIETVSDLKTPAK